MNIPLPEYQRLLEPTLAILQKASGFLVLEDISDTLIDVLGISMIELAQPLPSGRQTKFENQLQWALSYLEQDNLVECDGSNGYRLRRNIPHYKATTSEHYHPCPHPPALFPYQPILDLKSVRKDNQCQQGGETLIAEEFEALYDVLVDKVITRVHKQTPEFFEKLIIDLLLSMGYGDRKRDISRHLGRSGDGGVDGAIQQDQLGLDVVYIQAKRYKPGTAVPVTSVRDFAGALEAQKANKGVFVTTSHFTKASRTFVSAVSSRITLIDGARLASLLVRNNIGVKISETWEIKHLDEEYFL